MILLSFHFFYIEHVSPANMVVYRVKCTVIWCLPCCVERKSVPIGYKVAFWESEDWNADKLPYQLCPALTLSSRPAPFLEIPCPVYCLLGCRAMCHCDADRTKIACLILTMGLSSSVRALSPWPQLAWRDQVGDASPGSCRFGAECTCHCRLLLYWKRLAA